jgi:hypothetical protein
MKLHQLIVIGCLSIMGTGCGTAHSYCRQVSTCEPQCVTISDCDCTDPACYRAWSGCLEGVKCCEVFGNIGAQRCFDTDQAYYVRDDASESYFANDINGDISPGSARSYETISPSRVVRSYKMENYKGQ